MSQLFILYESATGYCLFEKEEFDEAGSQLPKIQKAILDMSRFTKMVKISANYSFKTAEEALDNIMAIRENKITDQLKNFLVTNLPSTKTSKKQKFLLGLADANMGREMFNQTGITGTCNDSIRELIRGIRTHFVKLMKGK